MRITCPNCGAQYEVPDEVIPTEGRDVQCSNCGDTWFQAHPDHEAESERVPEPAARPEPPPPEREPTRTPAPREIDPTVVGILREEKDHETRIRARESAALESQGDLGLDSLPADEASKRSRETRDRMARMRGETPAEVEPAPADRPRSRLLPDVEEINSTLSASDRTPAPTSAVAFPVEPPPRRGGFARGFGVVVLLTVVLVVLYANTARISAAVPALAPALEAYSGAVDSLRIWLDARLSGYLPR